MSIGSITKLVDSPFVIAKTTSVGFANEIPPGLSSSFTLTRCVPIVRRRTVLLAESYPSPVYRI